MERGKSSESITVSLKIILMAALFIVIPIALALPAAATSISECTTISTPGYYTLTADIINSGAYKCIEITASNVVLDGQGHTIDGTDASGSYGIYVHDPSTALTNVTVKNLVITDWYRGIYYQNSHNGRIENNTVNSNNHGIYLWSSSNNNIVNNTATSNYYGIYLAYSSNNNIVNNTATSNRDNGIYLSSYSNYNNIVTVTLQFNP